MPTSRPPTWPASWSSRSDRLAGRRWSIEESFQATKTGLGLDQHQHRRWKAWHRWTTLVIAAQAFLAAAAAASVESPDDLIAITVNELADYSRP